MKNKFVIFFLQNFYVIFFSLIIFINFFSKNIFYFNIDEINSINFYSNFYTFLITNEPNNHVITNFIGTLGTTFFGYNIYYFKSINFFFCILIFFIFHNFYKNYNFLLIFLLLFFISNNLYTYSYLYRGYYFSSLIFSIIFILIWKNKNFFQKKFFNTIFLLLAFLCIHSVYVFFLTVPILIANFYQAAKKLTNKTIIINFFLFFLIPFITIEFSKWIFTGLYLVSKTINSSDYNSLFAYLSSKSQNNNFLLINYFDNKFFNLSVNFFSLIYSGMLQIYFNKYTFGNIFQNENFIISFKFFFQDPVTFFIYFSSLLFAIKNLIKSFNILDFIVLFFFIFLFVSMKTPPGRVYIGFIGFFIFYFFLNVKILNIINFNGKLFRALLFIFIFYLSFNKNLIFEAYQVWNINYEKNNQFCAIDDKFIKSKLRTEDEALEKNLAVFNYFTKCPNSSFKNYIKIKNLL
jgi:hypothetical protein